MNKHKTRTTYLHFIKVRTKLLSQLRFFLNLSAFVLLAILLLWPYLEDNSRQASEEVIEESFKNSEVVLKSENSFKNQVLEPHFTGWDKKGQFFSIKAHSTEETNGSKGGIQDKTHALTDLDASIKLLSGELIHITAKKGLLNSHEKTLRLTEQVFIDHSQGYKINTTDAIVYYGDSLIVGRHPINGIGPQGILRANGFRIEDSGSKVILEGQTFVEIKPKK